MKRGKFGRIRWDIATFIVALFMVLLFFYTNSDMGITGYDTFVATAVPSAPTLLLPENGSSLLFNANNGFNWSGSDPDSNPMNYFFQVGNSTGFENGNLSVNITLLDTNVTLVSNNLSLGKYYWRVRANDSEGNSAFSAVREFYVVYGILNMTSPVNNSVVTAKNSQTIQIEEAGNGDLISAVNLLFTVNGANTTYTALNTTDTPITNYTYSYTVPDINSTYIDLVVIGSNESNTVNVTSYYKLRVTRSFSEANIDVPSLEYLCGFPTVLEQNTTMNITVNFTADVLVGYVNLSVLFPNGSSLDLQPAANNFKEYSNISFGYRYNYTFNTSVLGEFNMSLQIRDINYPTSSAVTQIKKFTVSNLLGVNLTGIGGSTVQVRDTCSKGIIYSGVNITQNLPSGVYDLLFKNSNLRLEANLFNSNITAVNNLTVCNFTDLSETVSVPTTTRAIDQFEFVCNKTLGFNTVNITYNYSAITASVTSENDLEFYKCTSPVSCTWVQFLDANLDTVANLFKINITNFSVFMISEQVTPTGGGAVSSSGSGSSGGSGGTKIATLDLIKPENIEFFENETIRIPITLKNTGEFTLYTIFLDASINNELFSLRLGSSTVEMLVKGQTFSTFLEVKNNGAEPGQYEITLKSTVFSPSFTDTTKLFLDLKDKEVSKKQSLLDQLEFMNELFRGNPECLEFSEIVGEVRSLIDKRDYGKATKLVDNTISGCRELIALDEAELNFPFRSVRAKSNFGLFVIESVMFLSITAILYYFYQKRKHR